MVNLPEKMIFSTGARESGREFGVAESPAESEEPPEAPEDQNRRARRDFADLKPRLVKMPVPTMLATTSAVQVANPTVRGAVMGREGHLALDSA